MALWPQVLHPGMVKVGTAIIPKKSVPQGKCVLAFVPSHLKKQKCWWGEEKLLENSSHAFFTASKVSSAIPILDSPLISSPKQQVTG